MLTCASPPTMIASSLGIPDPTLAPHARSRRRTEVLPLPDFTKQREIEKRYQEREWQRQNLLLSKKLKEDLSPHELELYEQLTAKNQKRADAHLAALKKRVNTALVPLIKDRTFPFYRRVRFDGMHILPEWTAEAETYFWIELSPEAKDHDEMMEDGEWFYCPANRGKHVYCTNALPPLGWSRWIYRMDDRCAKDALRSGALAWDIREGELISCFREWNGKSALEEMDAAAVIEECRISQKRLNDEALAASPFQLCLNVHLEDGLRQIAHPYCRAGIAELRFSKDGWAVETLCILTVANLILLSKHEVAVLARRPKLTAFLFRTMDSSSEDINDDHWKLDEEKREQETLYASRDLRNEIQLVVDYPHPQMPVDRRPPSWGRSVVIEAYESMLPRTTNVSTGMLGSPPPPPPSSLPAAGAASDPVVIPFRRGLDDSLVTEDGECSSLAMEEE